VLEVNDHPSLNIYFEKEFMGGKKPTEEDICPVDLMVKSTVVIDTIELARKKHSSIEEIDEFESLTKIHPNADCESSAIATVLQQLRTLFYKLCPIKSKSFISCGCFEKLITLNFFSK